MSTTGVIEDSVPHRTTTVTRLVSERSLEGQQYLSAGIAAKGEELMLEESIVKFKLDCVVAVMRGGEEGYWSW